MFIMRDPGLARMTRSGCYIGYIPASPRVSEHYHKLQSQRPEERTGGCCREHGLIGGQLITSDGGQEGMRLFSEQHRKSVNASGNLREPDVWSYKILPTYLLGSNNICLTGLIHQMSNQEKNILGFVNPT